MMLIRKAITYQGQFTPVHKVDIPMFMHCCAGMIAVTEIAPYLPVFAAHDIQVMIQDETLTRSKGEDSK